MRIRFTLFVAIPALVAIAFLIACSSKYTSSSNGLVVVPSAGSLVMQSFSLNLGNGHVSQINNAAGPPIPGIPASIILDPAGAFAYVIVTQSPAAPGSSTGIASFQVASDGKLSFLQTTALNNTTSINPTSLQCESLPVNPVALAIDSTGKYLFVANSAATDSSGNSVAGSVSVLAVGGNAALTEVNPVSCTNTSGSPFPLPPQDGQIPAPSALAVTPTVYPAQFAACSGSTPPGTENLYVTDNVNYLLLNYSVDTSTGMLTPQPLANGAPGIATGTVPSGVAVDPCNRFVYVSNTTSQSVSAYKICSSISIPANCPSADFSLQAVTTSTPFTTGDAPGPLAIDPYGNFLYVVDTGSSQVSAFKISSSSGSLTSIAAYATGQSPNSIAIRNDETWVFVANFTSSTISQYAITPATGGLTPQAPFTPQSSGPTGVAVK